MKTSLRWLYPDQVLWVFLSCNTSAAPHVFWTLIVEEIDGFEQGYSIFLKIKRL